MFSHETHNWLAWLILPTEIWPQRSPQRTSTSRREWGFPVGSRAASLATAAPPPAPPPRVQPARSEIQESARDEQAEAVKGAAAAEGSEPRQDATSEVGSRLNVIA
mgnify:CR=1 FL=1